MSEEFYTNIILKNHSAVKIVGKHTYGNPEILHWGEDAMLSIGSFCSIAQNVKIFLGGNHKIDWVSTYPFSALSNVWINAKDIKGHPATKGDVIIGNDVWIGHSVTILSGVTIGDGAVIGAETVVTKDVEPYSIVAGNPAKEIKKRFKKEDIDNLLNIKWWEWDDEKISENVDLLCNENISYFINKYI